MSDFDDKMAQLRVRFRARAIEDRGRLAIALQLVDMPEIGRIAHGLSGSAAVFGFPEISEAAERVEDAIDAGAGLEAISPALAVLLDRLAALEDAGPEETLPSF